MELRDIRRLFRIYDVLNISPRKRVIVCPLPGHHHHNNTPSFSIGVGRDGFDRFHCHGTCGREGDVIDLVGYLNITGYNDKDPEHIQRAISLLSSSVPMNIATPQYVAPGLPNNTWMDYPLGKQALDFAVSRGLTPATVDKFHLGQRQLTGLSIPIFCEDVLWGIKFRRISGPGTRYWSERGSRMALFNVDNVAWREIPVFILKGEIPVMLLDQLGLYACCMTGGEASKISDWKHYLSFASKRILVGDNDKDPDTRKKMQDYSKERAEQWNAELRFPPEKYKDIDEWLLDEPGALEVIRSWYG